MLENKQLESQFQAKLIKELKRRFPDCIVIKNDPNYIQGIPDLLILNGAKWGALECKKDEKASKRPNQEYYVDKMHKMSYAAFIFPENEKEVLNELEQSLRS